MPALPTVLFGRPQHEVATLIVDRMGKSSATSIVTGFLTPAGLAAIASPIFAYPGVLKTLVVGAATYPGFEALDGLLAAGVPTHRLYVHLGHTSPTGGKKNPFARYHPMLHSKVYYMELPGSNACAFIGSHNVTSFALKGLNGEAAVMLEGPMSSPEFQEIRKHIDVARKQATQYSPEMKEAYAWWMREFIEGLKAEMKIPQDWTTIRTILLFAVAKESDRPKPAQQLYFEIPAGIEQIESLKTETHLFLFHTLPADPQQALLVAQSADARYTCTTLGAENKQGNRELVADWQIGGTPHPMLSPVPTRTLRPGTPPGMQQVRAEVSSQSIVPFDYRFDRDKVGWNPEYSPEEPLSASEEFDGKAGLSKSRDGGPVNREWKLVKTLSRRDGPAMEKDQIALSLASPESGSFILVSLRRRPKDDNRREEDDN